MDWAAVRDSGRTFGICKATEGIGYTADSLDPNALAINAAGLYRGFYHFARPDSNAASDEAAHFWQAIELLYQPSDRLVLDIEDGSGNLLRWTAQFLAEIQRLSGSNRITLYSTAYFLRDHNCLDDAISDADLWLAAYQETQPEPPAPWTQLWCWQNTDKAIVPGVQGLVDEDVLLGEW